MANILLELSGKHFQRQYLLYIIRLSHGDDTYFYIGQTGDNNYVTARPAFRRLAAHFEEGGRSTQNQVYRYIGREILKIKEAENRNSVFSEQTKQSIEEYLVESIVRMHAYALEPFSAKSTDEEHSQKRRKATELEKHVIYTFHKNNKRLMNKTKSSLTSDANCPYPKVLEQIRYDFDLK